MGQQENGPIPFRSLTLLSHMRPLVAGYWRRRGCRNALNGIPENLALFDGTRTREGLGE